MIFQCPFCQLDTAGNHAFGCPNSPLLASGGIPDNEQLNRIEQKLNRLLNLLDSKRDAPCARCGNPAKCPTILPYGSRYDGWVVCGKCIAELIDPAIFAASTAYNTMDDFIASLEEK